MSGIYAPEDYAHQDWEPNPYPYVVAIQDQPGLTWYVGPFPDREAVEAWARARPGVRIVQAYPLMNPDEFTLDPETEEQPPKEDPDQGMLEFPEAPG